MEGYEMLVTSVLPFFAGSESAEVTVTDGTHACCAFCHPCSIQVGTQLTEPMNLFDDELMLVLADEGEPWIVNDTTDQSGLRHHGVARVSDLDGLLSIGGLRLKADRLPGGLQIGDLVEFKCVRIDIC